MKEARAVYEKLMEAPLFRGIYDAKNGNEHFMYGIATVMEYIANLVSEDTYEKYNEMLHRNMTASEERAEQTEPKERFIVVKDGTPTVMHRQTDCSWK